MSIRDTFYKLQTFECVCVCGGGGLMFYSLKFHHKIMSLKSAILILLWYSDKTLLFLTEPKVVTESSFSDFWQIAKTFYVWQSKKTTLFSILQRKWINIELKVTGQNSLYLGYFTLASVWFFIMQLYNDWTILGQDPLAMCWIELVLSILRFSWIQCALPTTVFFFHEQKIRLQ